MRLLEVETPQDAVARVVQVDLHDPRHAEAFVALLLPGFHEPPALVGIVNGLEQQYAGQLGFLGGEVTHRLLIGRYHDPCRL